MILSKQWFGVYTRAGSEKKVVNLLNSKGIENYCPLNYVVTTGAKMQYKPLFASFIFVRVQPGQEQKLRATSGIINTVYRLQHPAVFPDAEIESIRDFMEKHINVTAMKINLQIGEKIKASGNSLMITENQELNLTGKKAEIVLSSFGYVLSAKPETVTNVKLIRKNNYSRYKTVSSFSFFMPGFRTNKQ